jgi:hypothetical protein
VEYDLGGQLYASGDEVFLIGLQDGRVNIAKAKGGTSRFERI